jgi:alpha/beta superfamily hydrolase
VTGEILNRTGIWWMEMRNWMKSKAKKLRNNFLRLSFGCEIGLGIAERFHPINSEVSTMPAIFNSTKRQPDIFMDRRIYKHIPYI